MESCICGAFTNLNQYMWNLVNRTYFHTSSILCLRWKDKYQTAKGGLQANVNGMISIQRAIFKITKWSLGTKRRAHAKHVWPAWVWLSSTIQVQLIKYPINRKDWIQLVSKWFDDKTAPKRTTETSVRYRTTAKSAKCKIKFKCTISFWSYIYSYLSYRFNGCLRVALAIFMCLPTCSKSFAHWTGTGRLTR